MSHTWREHGLVLLLFLLLSLALTWPLARVFTDALVGVGDTRHSLWLLWHAKQALLTPEPLFSTQLLYYPLGITLLGSGLGPLLGVVTLPLWPLGPEAARNGATLIGFWLTGYGMYLLARGLGLGRSISFFAGTVLLAAPMHVGAVTAGHLPKVFLGLIPLSLLAAHHALDVKRPRWWAPVAGFMLLLTLLHSGNQFILAGIGVVFMMGAGILSSSREERGAVMRRAMLVSASTLVLTGPLLITTAVATSQPLFEAGRNLESVNYQPDLLQFLLPVRFTSRFTGSLVREALGDYVGSGFETAVFVSWTVLLLSLLALAHRDRRSRQWLLLALLAAVIALGPSLTIAGRTTFTEYNLPIIMPYAFLTALPGLDFWRTPGRFMLLGFVALAITAGFGLDWLRRRLPQQLRGLLVGAAVVLVLFESWPLPAAYETLPPVPPFYEQIAGDNEVYGVLDLPFRPMQKIGFFGSYVMYSSYYMSYQMTHGKGIAAGYLSRYYVHHPLFGHFLSNSISYAPLQSDVLVNGKPANRYANAAYELARHGYRYVVWHKQLAETIADDDGAWAEAAARTFVEEALDSRAPEYEDEYTRVYRVPTLAEGRPLTMTLALMESSWQNWLESRTGSRWAVSPAVFYVASPRSELAYLDITPSQFRSRGQGAPPQTGELTLECGGVSATAALTVNETTTLPLILPSGSSTLTTTLRTAGAGDLLDFAIEAVHLRTTGGAFPPPDIYINKSMQDNLTGSLVAIHGSGWYNAEGPAWRWAESPAELWVAWRSTTTGRVRLTLWPAALYDPAAPDGLGESGTMRIHVNGQLERAFAVEIDQPATVEVQVDPGWNRITLVLESENFQPADRQPGNGDQRQLSFALTRLEIESE
ncbi:MAG: hypothetical protein PVG11_03085 [Anaerolineae bacterium]|jgi:hypothetical protein